MRCLVGRWTKAVIVFSGAVCFFIIYSLLPKQDFYSTGSFTEFEEDVAEPADLPPGVAGYNRFGVPIYRDTGYEQPPGIQYSDTVAKVETPTSLDDVIYDHPRLFGTRERWSQLRNLIIADPYLKAWSATILGRAEKFRKLSPTNYSIDGSLEGSGVLDAARAVQLRIKHWAYAYRLTGINRWKQRIWEELIMASGNSSRYFGEEGDNWNTHHWLDVGEFLVAFAYAYDWLYDAWTPEERQAIMWSMINLGLRKGLEAHNSEAWFLSVRSNWNCVANGGMIVGALAVFHEDSTGIARELLPKAVGSARQYCAKSIESDGTWAETPDYWYFGTQAHAQMSSALLTATGSTHGMMDAHAAFVNTSLFHIYNFGMTNKFNYGDCGPVKLTATANSLFLYGDWFGRPLYSLYQRDRLDAADPLSMLWYNTNIQRPWFHGLPLDREFPDSSGAWVSMRSSWADPSGIFVAAKAGRMTGHASHGNLDAGDFVLDALGERWASELCQDDYLADGYFSSEEQDSQRWRFYRCATAGQNTILLAGANQVAGAEPSTRFAASEVDGIDTAWWITDLTSAYNGTRVSRGLRLLDGRRRVLIQDEIYNREWAHWRMHTDASIDYEETRRKAFLTLNGKKLTVILQSPSTLQFRTLKATWPNRAAAGKGARDLENTGVNVLAIDIKPGFSTIRVIFCPARDDEEADTSLPNMVDLNDWTLESHG